MMNTFVPSFANDTVAFPALVTVQENIDSLLDRWQNWSDETFGGEYRDAAETLIWGLLLLVGCTAIRSYDHSKRCLGQALGYWLADAEQQLLAESGLWLEQLVYELLPVSQCLNECWAELEMQVAADWQILAYEVAVGVIAAETQ